MRIFEHRYSLQFNNNIFVTNKISLICLIEKFTFIRNSQLFFAFIRNTSEPKLSFQCFLVNRFEEAMT